VTGPSRAAAGVWAALAALSSLPYLVASAWPPAHHRFNGAFFWLDDYYQYLSFAEQAARGAPTFANKFDPGASAAALVNLEWWLAGVLGALPGSSLDLGFHVLRLAAFAALVAGAARVLRALGREDHALWRALLLVFVAGGPGVWRLMAGGDPRRIADVSLALYPWSGLLLNAHFVVGTALLLWTLLLHLDWLRGRARAWAWIALGWALGFSRPYDLAVFGLTAAAVTAFEARGGGASAVFRRLLPLAALAPVFLYYVALLGTSSLGGWASQGLDRPAVPLEVAAALAPGAALWLLAALVRRQASPALAVAEGRSLLAWGLIVPALVALWPSPMAKQFAIALGLPWLLLAAAALPARALLPAALALLPTSLFLLHETLTSGGGTFSPRGHWAAVEALRRECRAGDVVVGPPLDLTMMVAARTPCAVNVGHRLLTPQYLAAARDAAVFYDPRTPPAWRATYLDRHRAGLLLLPAGGESMVRGLGGGWAPLLREATVEVWRRPRGGAGPE
jgi:hypothetical protein